MEHNVLDGLGLYGAYFVYANAFMFALGTVLLFFYFLKKKKLDFDEEPKWQMMKKEVDDE